MFRNEENFSEAIGDDLGGGVRTKQLLILNYHTTEYETNEREDERGMARTKQKKNFNI